MSSGPARAPVPVILLLVAAGVGLTFAPAPLQTRVGNLLRDGIVPGQRAVQEIAARLFSRPTRSQINPSTLAQEPARVRELELELARLQSQLRDVVAASEQTASTSGSTGAENYTGDQPLLRSRGIPARVLSGFAGQQWRRLVTVDKGRYGGITEEALVLEGDGPLIDVGRNAGAGDRDLLTSGRHVVGQISQTGQFSSVVRPISASEFRGAARLARRSPAGLSFGAVGTLRGTGDDRCELIRILPNEPVEPGDLVVTMASDSGVERPWIYGVVETAALSDNALEWSIQVRPACRWEDLERVHVVRLEPNPNRTAALPGRGEVER
jgi:cell shape-determining protein MreC